MIAEMAYPAIKDFCWMPLCLSVCLSLSLSLSLSISICLSVSLSLSIYIYISPLIWVMVLCRINKIIFFFYFTNTILHHLMENCIVDLLAEKSACVSNSDWLPHGINSRVIDGYWALQLIPVMRCWHCWYLPADICVIHYNTIRSGHRTQHMLFSDNSVWLYRNITRRT